MTSADQFFSDEPRIRIPEANLAKATKEAKKIQARLDQLIDGDGIIGTFQDGAEIASALGGVLMVTWDEAFKDKADDPSHPSGLGGAHARQSPI